MEEVRELEDVRKGEQISPILEETGGAVVAVVGFSCHKLAHPEGQFHQNPISERKKHF
jgi:hypothetical protein